MSKIVILLFSDDFKFNGKYNVSYIRYINSGLGIVCEKLLLTIE